MIKNLHDYGRVPAGADTPAPVSAHRVSGRTFTLVAEQLAVESPLEIRLEYGPSNARVERPVSVTMRTPGMDFALAVGFLITEGVIGDVSQVEDVRSVGSASPDPQFGNSHSVLISLYEDVTVNLLTLERNFYATSSCGICGKASLLALRSVSPPRRQNLFRMRSGLIYTLPSKLRSRQNLFEQTGGLHAAALFNDQGELQSLCEDVGRHNAVDKLIGSAALADEIPLANSLLLLSGRASFELLQKAVMSGIPLIAAIGAPSSLAVRVANDFDITLVGFLRDDYFNIYHGFERIDITD